MTQKLVSKTGIARIWAAFAFSFSGLGMAFKKEAAFRQELGGWVILLIVLCFLPLTILFKCLLLLANTMVLIVELLNSAIESAVDLASPEYHALAKQAKDMGSAAVFTSLAVTVVLWGVALITVLYRQP